MKDSTHRARATIAGLLGVVVAASLLLAPSALGKGKPGGGGTCTPATPTVFFENNYAWAQDGSWGVPGQQLTYLIDVRNMDVACGSSTFAVTVSAPTGFGLSQPTSTVTLASATTGYLSAYVTAPALAVDGNYPLVVSVSRAGVPAVSATSYYKVYSSDTAAPTLFWPNPSDGQALSGKSYMINVSSSDDHAVKSIDLSVDGRYLTTTACDDISYTCQLSYKLSLSGMSGQHVATFTSHDWMGNSASLSSTFTVG